MELSRKACVAPLLCVFAFQVLALQGAAPESAAPKEQFSESAMRDGLNWLLGTFEADEKGVLVMSSGSYKWKFTIADVITLKGIAPGSLVEVGYTPREYGFEVVALINHDLPDRERLAVITAQFQEGKHASLE